MRVAADLAAHVELRLPVPRQVDCTRRYVDIHQPARGKENGFKNKTTLRFCSILKLRISAAFLHSSSLVTLPGGK
jgi:hypothetical protein